jgi:hypothetical protein
MSKAGYSITTEGVVALAANVPKTILGWKAGTAFGLDVAGWSVSFDGVDSTQVPVLVHFCYATFATNPPGTASTSVTPQQEYGRVLAHGTTAAKTWTTEPTVLTTNGLRQFILDPNKGFISDDRPLGQFWDSALGEGFALRLTVPAGGAAVNVRATMWAERC